LKAQLIYESLAKLMRIAGSKSAAKVAAPLLNVIEGGLDEGAILRLKSENSNSQIFIRG
jgi:hypothetical protein